MVKILGILGPACAGKDSSADALIKNNLITGKLAFADPLKQICSEVFDINKRLFYDQSLKEQNFVTPIVLTLDNCFEILEKCQEYVSDDRYSDIIRFDDLVGTVIKTPRYLLQFIGSELIRQRFHDGFHVEATLNRVKKCDGIFAITDIRYMNEFETIKKEFPETKFVYIRRPIAEERLSKNTHMSEKDIPKLSTMVDVVINNDKTLLDLEDAVKLVFTSFYK